MKDYTKKRRYILVTCCLANLCLGSVYAWSVFASPMAEYLSQINGINITTGDLAIVYTIANSVGPITMISGGWFNDRFGPKIVLLVGGVMFGLGMFLSGFATSIGYLIFTYLICVRLSHFFNYPVGNFPKAPHSPFYFSFTHNLLLIIISAFINICKINH